jgi:hypothetical protein
MCLVGIHVRISLDLQEAFIGDYMNKTKFRIRVVRDEVCSRNSELNLVIN